MLNKIFFTKKTPYEVLQSKKSGVLNFQNLYSVYLFHKEPIYQKALTSPNNFIFPDGRIVGLFLDAKQIRGSSFTKNFLESELNKDQKHFFILPEIEDFTKLVGKFPDLKNSKAYSPSYIQCMVFPEEEVSEIAEQINQFKPNFVWVCIGNPKQEILANQLYKKCPTFYFVVGAAIDFLLERKKESPSIFRKVGLEWFYRLITDFEHSKKKVWRSLLGLKYLRNGVEII